MKIASLIIGLLLMALAGVALVICLLLPSMTNNRVDFEESLLGAIPAAFVFFLALILTIVSAVFVLKAKRNAS